MTTTERIDAILKSKGMSRRQAAISAGISPSTFQSAMERGRNISIDMLQSLAAALDVPVSEFIEPARMSTKESRRRQEERMGLEPGYLDRGEGCFNRVLFAYADLNDAGRIEAAKRIEELAQLPQYKRGE